MGFNLSLLACRRPRSCDANEVARLLFPKTKYVEDGTLDLVNAGWPNAGELYIGGIDAFLLVSARDLMLFNPSKLHARFHKLTDDDAYLFSQQSALDMFAFGVWTSGTLTRSLSVNPVAHVWENVGEPLMFEQPFWAGDRPSRSPGYSLPFHPLDLSAAALDGLLGLGFESPSRIDADTVHMIRMRKA